MAAVAAAAMLTAPRPVIESAHLREVGPVDGPEMVGRIQLHPAQLRAFNSQADITLVVAGIRGGKTHVGALKTIFYAMAHPCSEDDHHLVLSPTYQMSKVPVEKLFKLLYDKTIFPVSPLLRYIKSERAFILAADGGGITRITVRSLHEWDRLRGLKALSAWIDEGAYVAKEAWEVVQGRLADVDGPCWITTTPAGYNWVWELYERALEEQEAGIPVAQREVRVVHFPSLANPFVSQRGFDRLVRSFDSKTYRQEVEGLFVKVADNVYHAFARKRNVRSGRLDPRLPLWIGQDFNVGAMASIIAQPYSNSEHQPGIHILRERLSESEGTYGLVKFLDAFCSSNGFKKEQVTVFPDASGRARSTTGKSDFHVLRQAGYRVDAPKRNPLVKDRTNCVNGLLRPMITKHPRVLVDPECVRTIESFEKQTYVKDSNPPEPDKAHGFDHLMDAVGYLCWRKWPLRFGGSIGKAKRAA